MSKKNQTTPSAEIAPNVNDTQESGNGTPNGGTPEITKVKGKPGRKSPMTQAEKDNMAAARKAAAESKEILFGALLGDDAEKPGVWEKLAAVAPSRLLGIRKQINNATQNALKARVAAAEAELAKVRQEAEAAMAEFTASNPAAEQAAG